jgi:hypothetical protein
VDERLYIDTWGLKASSTDIRWYLDASSRVRLGGHLRFHVQSAVDFWRLAYVAETTSQGLRVPSLRTEARELGALYTPTEGLDVRTTLDPMGRFALTFGGALSETKFINQLFIDHRLGFTGTMLFEAEFK